MKTQAVGGTYPSTCLDLDIYLFPAPACIKTQAPACAHQNRRRTHTLAHRNPRPDHSRGRHQQSHVAGILSTTESDIPGVASSSASARGNQRGIVGRTATRGPRWHIQTEWQAYDIRRASTHRGSCSCYFRGKFIASELNPADNTNILCRWSDSADRYPCAGAHTPERHPWGTPKDLLDALRLLAAVGQVFDVRRSVVLTEGEPIHAPLRMPTHNGRILRMYHRRHYQLCSSHPSRRIFSPILSVLCATCSVRET